MYICQRYNEEFVCYSECTDLFYLLASNPVCFVSTQCNSFATNNGNSRFLFPFKFYSIDLYVIVYLQLCIFIYYSFDSVSIEIIKLQVGEVFLLYVYTAQNPSDIS